MFTKNPITAESLSYLRKHHAFRWWNVILLVIAISVGAIFIWRGYSIENLSTIYMMAGIVLPIYWHFQFRMMHSANKLKHYDWQTDLSENLVGTISYRQVRITQVWIVLWHYRLVIALLSISLLGVSLSLTGALRDKSWQSIYPEYSRGIFENVGMINVGNSVISQHFNRFRFSDYFAEDTHPTYKGAGRSVLIMSAAMAVMTLSSSLLSAVIGLSFTVNQHWIIRLAIILGALLIFWGLFSLRQTSILECTRYGTGSIDCDFPKLTLVRFIDSLQAMALSFLDGSIGMVSGLHSCGYHMFRIFGYQGRHLFAVIATVASQFALSTYLLNRASTSFKKKVG